MTAFLEEYGATLFILIAIGLFLIASSPIAKCVTDASDRIILRR